LLYKFSAFFANVSNISSNREEALTIMRWLYLVALCVELVAYKNPDGKFFPSSVFFQPFIDSVALSQGGKLGKGVLEEARCFLFMISA